MITFNGLPLFRVALASAEDGVLRVSLVDDPAVQSNFDVFSKAGKAPVLYAVQDEEKRLVRGVVLRADFPIYRRDNPQDPGYYVTFGKETIRQIAEKYLADGRQNAVDTAHDGNEVDDVQMVQFFIKDTAAGIAPEGFDDIADGSLFAEYHVTNDDVWDEIKAGTFKGFSVEIFYTLIPAADMMRSAGDGEVDDVVGLLLQILSKTTNMSKMQLLRATLARILCEFGSVTTDKGILKWDGDEDLKAGDRVYIDDADGNRQDAADGDYVTEDGKTVVVVNGAVSEIRDPEAEVAPEGNDGEDAEQMARKRGARFEESYGEKERKIADAIRAARGSREDDYGYLASAGDDFGVWAHYGEDTGWEDKFVRYAIAWDEAGNATASDPVDCRMAFVPMDFDDSAAFRSAPAAEAEPEGPSEEEFEQAVRAASDYKAQVAKLQARVDELEAKPAGKSARETYNGKPGEALLPKSTGDRGLDRLARINRK